LSSVVLGNKKEKPMPPPKNPLGFNPGLFIADENGSIFYFRRPQANREQLVGVRVSTPRERWDFTTMDELIDKGIFPRQRGRQDNSVAVVKMLLALGVTTAAIPRGIIDPGTDESGRPLTQQSTSYVINLASFDKRHAFWPDRSVTRIALGESQENNKKLKKTRSKT
jgi:hypothetical protein